MLNIKFCYLSSFFFFELKKAFQFGNSHLCVMGFLTITLNLMMLLYKVIKKCLWFEVTDWEPGTCIGSYEGMKNFGM